MQILSYISHCIYSIIYILLYNGWKKKEIKKDEKVSILAHNFYIYICIVVDINSNVVIDNVLGKNLLTKITSTILYQLYCICRIDY